MIKKAQVSDIIDDDKYILLYHLDPGKELDNIISQIRKFTGYKTISIIGNRKYWYSDCYLKDYGPYDFLWLIKKAKYVLTGSFHAICFSLMFKTPFVVQLPEKSPNRLSNILKEVNMLDRIIDKNNPVETICNSPIKPEAYLTLAKMIESSKLQLNSDVALIKGENND